MQELLLLLQELHGGPSYATRRHRVLVRRKRVPRLELLPSWRIPGESHLPLLEDLIDLGPIIAVHGWHFSLSILFDVFLLRLLNYLLLILLLLHLLESSPFEYFLLSLYEHVLGNVSRSELVLA